MLIEFIYDSDCPNVKATRENLIRALVKSKVQVKWVEWERGDANAPEYTRQFGSPSILINGSDITGQRLPGATSCRVYSSGGQMTGVPSVELISGALIGNAAGVFFQLRKHTTLLPALAVALLPKVTCPACWPAYAGLLSAVGLGFLLKAEYLLPATALFLAVALGALLFRAESRRGYWPFAVGLVGALTVLGGKFLVNSSLLFYGGLTLLVASSLWNSWPRKKSKTTLCPACTPVESSSPRVQRS